MQYRRLGNTEVDVSVICLGTMTFGEQNTEADGHAQLDHSVERGINFIDTAEMYAVPPRAETYGETERILGTWIEKRGRRDDVVIATKVAGPGDLKYIRGGARLDRASIVAALDASLQRLRTDYVDLYQVHWPERPANRFGKLDYIHTDQETAVPVEETLAALDECVQAGKVRYLGVSNETPWGVARYLRSAETDGRARIMSIQNPYSLLNRTFEIGLAEFSQREQVGLLAYSPLAFGVLTGKYVKMPWAPESRLARFTHFRRYNTERGREAAAAYVELARRYGLAPARMALAFVNSRPFLTSTIIGATTLEQLDENITSISVALSDELMAEIQAIHEANPNPCP